MNASVAPPGFRLLSSLDSTAWPAITTGPASDLLALQRQLDESQWWSPEKLREHQFSQLLLLARHAKQLPFYADRIPDTLELTEETWASIPPITRRDVQDLGDQLRAPVPKSHGSSVFSTSGGSTGVPVRVWKTMLSNVMWSAAVVREEIWHRTDPMGTMVRIRRVPPGLSPEHTEKVRSPEGLVISNYGPPMNMLWDTGLVGIMDDRVSIPDQAAFIRRLEPAYLFTFPANLRLLLTYFRDNGPAPQFKSVWTMSEIVDDTMRELCEEVFGCRIVHNYATAETGYLALQCPETSNFHVQSEFARVEVVNDEGRPCEPGEIGKVLLTPLHNFATPLIRYEVGDLAEVGGPCPCGRGLPVLKRIVGRAFDYLTLPSGERRHVDSGYYQLCKIACIREFQVVQRALNRIEVILVLSRGMTESEKDELFQLLAYEFGNSFEFVITVRDSIVRTEAGKLRTFISEVSP